jgi:SAM-dependent methyltransferase
MTVDAVCWSCGSRNLVGFYEMSGVPAHSVLQMPTRERAVTYPKGDIALGICRACGFVVNTAFQPELTEYSENYEETQGYSETFNTFHGNLAAVLVERYNLRGKDIVEIGCGKGDFLKLLCRMGGNRGVGFDPAYVPERSGVEPGEQIEFIDDFYSAKVSVGKVDFICCKMTLEHIQRTAEFVRMLRDSLNGQPETTVFFQVPDVRRVLFELAFWDVYYEHCSYFSAGSLTRLFRRCGFDVIEVKTDYDGQYLMITARPSVTLHTGMLAEEDDLAEIRKLASRFSRLTGDRLRGWKVRLQEYLVAGSRIVLWGGGSKGVAFLTTLGITSGIEYVVDINPYRQGMFMAGTGQEIVSPGFLRGYQPDVVIVMNPIYRAEIRGDLERMGLSPELILVTDGMPASDANCSSLRSRA